MGAKNSKIEEEMCYQENTECEYWQIFKGLNDWWLFVDLSPSAANKRKSQVPTPKTLGSPPG
jgi:hypothetical protein